MSFAFITCNEYGIVASADHCLTGTDKDGKRYTASNNCRKIFLSKQGYVLTYTGCSSVNDIPVPAKIAALWESPENTLSLLDFFSQFVSEMAVFCKENIVFLAAGYQNGATKIYTATTTNPQVNPLNKIGYSGETDIAQALLNIVPVAYNTITLQDSIDFHRFVTQSIARLQSFGACLQTVSETCDIVALGSNGIIFTQFNKLH